MAVNQPSSDAWPPVLARRSGLVVALLFVGLTYYLGARLGLSLSLVERNVTPLWPPTGIAVAAYLLLGRQMWPAVAAAAFAVNLPISTGVLAAAVTAVGNTLAPLVAVMLLSRFGFRRQLDRRRDALAIVFVALASMLVSALVGTTTLVVSDAIPGDRFLSAGAVWWTGDAMGVLVVAPFLLSLPLFWEGRNWPWTDWAEEVAIIIGVLAVSLLAVNTDLQVLFLSLPVVGWASWRLQLRGAAPAALIASLVVTWAAAHETGPFERGSLFEQMLTLQAFNACVALTSFFLAALVSERMRVAEEQLSREEARTQREHQIAVTLQRSLLPDRLPTIPGIQLAARYVPATGDVQVGGDWYDVVELPDGRIAMAIGDVAGHGVHAASTMGQLRMALRAYALQDPSPTSVMQGIHRLVSHLPMSELATLIYLVFDPASGQVCFSNAGHPPGLVISDSECTYLADGLAPPVGVTADDRFTEVTQDLPAGATLLLYTDGLVERRGESIQDGLDRLGLVAVDPTSDLEQLCDRVLSALIEHDEIADDIALVALRWRGDADRSPASP